MAFSQAQFQAAVDKINAGMGDLSEKMEQIMPAAQAGVDHWYIPDFIVDAVKWCADKLIEISKMVWDKIAELLKGVAAPVLFFVDAFEWEDVRGLANGVAGELTPQSLTAGRCWKGVAADAYSKTIQPQNAAVSNIAALADSVALALGVCAAVGLAFYVTLGIILAQYIITLVGGIAALGTGIFSLAGLGLIIGDTASVLE